MSYESRIGIVSIESAGGREKVVFGVERMDTHVQSSFSILREWNNKDAKALHHGVAKLCGECPIAHPHHISPYNYLHSTLPPDACSGAQDVFISADSTQIEASLPMIAPDGPQPLCKSLTVFPEAS